MHLKSKNKFGFYLFMGAFGFVSFGSVTWYLSPGILDSDAPIIGIILVGIFFTGAVLNLSIPFLLSKLLVDDDNLYVISLFGYTKKTIPLAEIISWNEVSFKGDRYTAAGNKLTLYTKKKKYKIVESYYSNYPEIKEVITKGKEKYTYIGGKSIT